MHFSFGRSREDLRRAKVTASLSFNPEAKATNKERCPVCFNKKFKSHSPANMSKPDVPFYLAINYFAELHKHLFNSALPEKPKPDRVAVLVAAAFL